ncbi:uncharacterized protein LOC126690834 [Quercus robur]|uniref:uncharacterized protein LOC126690834 n=1 Tax=Quercus robur TaxID=38942 RepID=UPI002163AF30|nr:uncharacterized protein LOC126690834 [Quercus robur]
MQEPRKDVSLRPPTGTIHVIFAAPGRTGPSPSRVLAVGRLPSEDRQREPKRVLVDPGSAIEVMNPDLYKGLNLRPEDLTAYDSPFISFEGKTVTPKGQIRLPIQTGSEVVEVNFIVVDAYSPYTAIVARPWIHALEAVSSTLHQKVKYPSRGQVEEIRGDQAMARQCMVAAISHRSHADSSASGNL